MRKAGIALSAFALAITLSACGDNGGGTSSDSSAGAAQLVALAKSIGDETSKANSAHMTITADAAGQKITGAGDLKFGSADSAIAMEMTTAQGSVSMVFVENVLYMKLPQELEPGKPWVKVDPNSDSVLAKALSSLNESLSKNADPRAALKVFENSGEVTTSKDEQLDGRKTTHYTITVDVRKMADNQADPAQKKAMQDAIAGGMKDFPVDVWVDEAGLPVRFAMDAPAPDGKGGLTSVKMRVDYTDWGRPVDIAPPPADQTTEPPA